jgi:ribosomal protein S18 acetylase RimI-like enzyme
MIRPAQVSDIPALVALEQRCFKTDRLSRRQFRYMLTKANAHVLLSAVDGVINGYVLLLFSRGTSMARLYSIAVDKSARGQGIGQALVAAAEKEARERDCAYLRLEIRKDNAASIALFTFGLRTVWRIRRLLRRSHGRLALRKSLAPSLSPELVRVPFYEQTLEFTCGPSALMMAMKALDPRCLELDRKFELRLWREATTIFMTSGHGGCGPFGLALAAAQRGFRSRGAISDERMPLIDSVRSEEKEGGHAPGSGRHAGRDAWHWTYPHALRGPECADLRPDSMPGGIPVVLISSYRDLWREVSALGRGHRFRCTFHLCTRSLCRL